MRKRTICLRRSSKSNPVTSMSILPSKMSGDLVDSRWRWQSRSCSGEQQDCGLTIASPIWPYNSDIFVELRQDTLLKLRTHLTGLSLAPLKTIWIKRFSGLTGKNVMLTLTSAPPYTHVLWSNTSLMSRTQCFFETGWNSPISCAEATTQS